MKLSAQGHIHIQMNFIVEHTTAAGISFPGSEFQVGLGIGNDLQIQFDFDSLGVDSILIHDTSIIDASVT